MIDFMEDTGVKLAMGASEEDRNPGEPAGESGEPEQRGAPAASGRAPGSALAPVKHHASVRELERLGDEIAELAAHLHAVTYRLLVRLRAFDRCFAEAGGGMGFRSAAEWLSWRTGIAPGAAREKLRVARALEPLPRLSRAMERGRISYSKACAP